MIFLLSGKRLKKQIHGFHALPMLPSGGHDINPGGVDAAVAQDVCQLCDVFFHGVKDSCKEMPQVVGEDLAFQNFCPLAEVFHFPPDATAVQRLSGPADEHGAGLQAFSFDILQQLPLQFLYQKDGAAPSFAADHGFPLAHGFHGDGLQLADADAGAADGLDDHTHPVVPFLLRRVDEAEVFCPGQFFFFGAVGLALDFELPDAAVIPAHGFEEAVDCRQHGVGAGHRISLRQMGFVSGRQQPGKGRRSPANTARMP